MNKLPHPRPTEEMDVLGDVFAIRFRRNNQQVELYTESGGIYHFRAVFDKDWLGDLINVCVEATDRD
jgi:hypothetical protein